MKTELFFGASNGKVAFRRYAELNTWQDCIVIVDKAHEEIAETAIQTGIEDYLDAENGKHDCYGDAIEAALSDANVSYTIFYYPDYDDEREYDDEWEQFANWIAQIIPLKTNHF